jgi:hypothetical protein
MPESRWRLPAPQLIRQGRFHPPDGGVDPGDARRMSLPTTLSGP